MEAKIPEYLVKFPEFSYFLREHAAGPIDY